MYIFTGISTYMYNGGTNLVLAVVYLAVLDDLVAELKQVTQVLVAFVCQVCHVEQRLTTMPQGDLQEVKYLQRRKDLPQS